MVLLKSPVKFLVAIREILFELILQTIYEQYQ